eukprot:6113237-Ditylum_brightwellii.AAC.1
MMKAHMTCKGNNELLSQEISSLLSRCSLPFLKVGIPTVQQDFLTMASTSLKPHGQACLPPKPQKLALIAGAWR